MRHTLRERARLAASVRVSSTLLAFTLIVLNTAFSCGDWPTDPGGGGRQPEPRKCQIAPAPYGHDAKWDQYQLSFQVTKPPCPMVIAATNSYVPFAGTVRIPSAAVGFGSAFAYSQIYDLSTQQNVAPQASAYANVYDPNGGAWKAELTTTGQPGISFAAPGPWDRFAVTVTNLASGDAHGAYDLPGRVEKTTPDIIGPTNVTPNTPYDWRLRPEWDTTAYVPSWKLDGNQISAVNQLRYSLPIGTHTLRGIVTRADNSVDSVSIFVYAQWTAQISGPTSVPTSYTGLWQATAPGGIAPYSYVWKLDGQVQSGFTSASYTHTFYTSGGPHYLQVIITDAAGNATGQSVLVTVQ